MRKNLYDGKLWWYIEYSETQNCMHIDAHFDRSRPNPEWEVVEKFYGTMEQVGRRSEQIYREKQRKNKSNPQ